MRRDFADAIAEFLFQEHQCGGSLEWSKALDRLYDLTEVQIKTSKTMKSAIDRRFPEGIPPPRM